MTYLKKRILVACIHYPVCSGRYITRALRRIAWVEMADPRYMPPGMALNDAQEGEEVKIRTRGKRDDFSPVKD